MSPRCYLFFLKSVIFNSMSRRSFDSKSPNRCLLSAQIRSLASLQFTSQFAFAACRFLSQLSTFRAFTRLLDSTHTCVCHLWPPCGKEARSQIARAWTHLHTRIHVHICACLIAFMGVFLRPVIPQWIQLQTWERTLGQSSKPMCDHTEADLLPAPPAPLCVYWLSVGARRHPGFMFVNRGGTTEARDDRSSAHRSGRNVLGNGAKRPDDSSSKTNFFILHAADLVSALSVSLSAALSSELSRVFSVTRWLSPKYISERMQMLSGGQGHFHIVPLFIYLFIFCECCSCSSSTRLRCQTDILSHKLGRR